MLAGLEHFTWARHLPPRLLLLSRHMLRRLSAESSQAFPYFYVPYASDLPQDPAEGWFALQQAA